MIGQKLGPYLIGEKLGSGAMGVVYLATDETTGSPVAVKVVHSESNMKSNTPDRFRRESDILKQFRHPNIVQHLGMGTSKSRNLGFYAMEYVPGRTLEQVLEERGALPWPEVVNLGIQICDALQYAHERGVVHRDLKPSNLLLHKSGRLKLTDFGIAKDLDRTALTATGRTLGTAAYMAPEQIRGTPEVSHKTDLYALGCVLYQMVTGCPPFEGKSAMVLMHKHLDEPPPRPSAKEPDIPLALDKLIVSLMAKNRDDRPWDAAAAGHILTELRAKLERKEDVRKVFGPPVTANPTRAPLSGTSSPAVTPTQGTTRTRKKARPRRPTGGDEPSIPAVRQWLETGLLVGGLVLAVAVLGYLLWPPSAAYLHRRAAEGMAGKSRTDWLLARRDYIDELERRYPDHPYKADVRQWLDRILLDQAQSRSRYLENPNLTAVTEPKNEAEAAFVRVFRAAEKDKEDGRDDEALTKWRALAGALKADENERGLFLLAQQRADALESVMAGRRKGVVAALLQAQAAEQSGRAAVAAEIRAEVLRQYGHFQHLADLLDPIRAVAPTEAAPATP
jgi:serine/threonine-protein kinase